MVVVYRNDPRLASDVEPYSVDSDIVLAGGDESGPYHVWELGETSHGCLDVTGTSTTLFDVGVVDTLVGVKEVDCWPVVLPPPEEVEATVQIGVVGRVTRGGGEARPIDLLYAVEGGVCVVGSVADHLWDVLGTSL